MIGGFFRLLGQGLLFNSSGSPCSTALAEGRTMPCILPIFSEIFSDRSGKTILKAFDLSLSQLQWTIPRTQQLCLTDAWAGHGARLLVSRISKLLITGETMRARDSEASLRQPCGEGSFLAENPGSWISSYVFPQPLQSSTARMWFIMLFPNHKEYAR